MIWRIVVAAGAVLALEIGTLADPARGDAPDTGGALGCVRVGGERPNGALVRAVVAAGGGLGSFRATALLDVLGGNRAHAELTELTRRHGAPAIRRFITTFDDVVSSAARRSAVDARASDATAPTEPADGAGLLRGLLACGTRGTAGATFDARTMLERIFSSSAYARAGHDVDAAGGQGTAATFERVLTELMRDLATT